MGRKPSVPKIIKVPMAENPSPEKVESQPSNVNIISSGVVDSNLQNSNLCGSPSMYPNPFLDGAVMHNERTLVQEQVNLENGLPKKSANEITPAQDQVNLENGLPKKSAKYTRKKSKSFGSSLRRSDRIKSAVVRSSNANRGAIEYILDDSESERDESMKDEPLTQIEKVLSEQEPELETEPGPAENLRENRLDEKLEHVLQRIEAVEKIITLLKSKVDEITGSCAIPSMASINYQSLYIESQKKIEALTGKLENALGKIEVYEKEHRVFMEVLDKMKDAVNASLVSNLAKATEAAVNASAQAMRAACSATATKRKRNAQDS